MVFRTKLTHVVVDIADAEVGFDTASRHGFVEEESCCAGCILC